MFDRVNECRLGAPAACCARSRSLFRLALRATSPALADEKITYLFPAPPLLPAFGPIQLAKGKGYFAQAGLDVNFAVGRGGVDVAKQVGAGNVPTRRHRRLTARSSSGRTACR